MRLSDDQIINGLKKRDTPTIKYIYKQFQGLCEYIVVSNNGTADDSKDIFQEAIIAVMNKVSKQDFLLTCKFQTYLFAVLDKLWKLELLKRKHARDYIMKELEKPVSIEEIKLKYDEKLISSLLYECFRKLGNQCQTILNMYWKGYSQKEIADALTYNYGYLRRKKTNCDQSLSQIIKENPEIMRVFGEDPSLISDLKQIR